jgi:hypothetical protein
MNVHSIFCPEHVICRPTLLIPLVVFAWTSTFSSPAGLNFSRFSGPQLTVSDQQAVSGDWLEYVYRRAHPVLRWLSTKLAEWIGENM